MTKYLDENGLLYLWGKLKATFLHNASEGRFTGVSTNTSTGLRTFNVPTIAEHIYYDSNKNSTLKDKIDTIVSQGGEPNTIETVKVNGTALVPDANKAVDITFKVDGISGSTINRYGVCSTAADTAIKTVNVTGGTFNLETGAQVTVKFTYQNTAAPPKLNVNGTGEKFIKYLGDTIMGGDDSRLVLRGTCSFVYDGEFWNIVAVESVLGYLPLSGGTMYDDASITMHNTGSEGIHYGTEYETDDYLIQLRGDGSSLTNRFLAKIDASVIRLLDRDDGNEVRIDNQGFTRIDGDGETSSFGYHIYLPGGIISQKSDKKSDTKVWNTNAGVVDLTTYALLASPAFTGTPTAPTATAGTDTTQIATTAFVKTAITNALGNFTGVSYEVVQTLPATGAAGTIYLISNSGTNPNIYDEYIYVNNGFEKIGTTDVDLTNYWSKTELVVIPNTTIDYIVANNALPTT